MRTTKAERVAWLHDRLAAMGFDYPERADLIRIERALQRWAERECGTENGCIERDEETGKAYWLNCHNMKRYPIRDMEGAALKRLRGIMDKHPKLMAFHQGDCRGCMLYILSETDLQPGERIDSVYTRGVAVCV